MEDKTEKVRGAPICYWWTEKPKIRGSTSTAPAGRNATDEGPTGLVNLAGNLTGLQFVV